MVDFAGRTVNSHSKEWCTPPKYADVIHEFFNNNLNLDPCSNEFSIINAKTKFMMPYKNGLIEEWDYKYIYVNPPYGADRENKTSIKDWFKKAFETYKNYNSEILMLVPVATNTSHWKEYVFGKATGVCFLYDTRLKFMINGNINNKGCPMACCFIYYGTDFEKFKNIFKKFGAVVQIK